MSALFDKKPEKASFFMKEDTWCVLLRETKTDQILKFMLLIWDNGLKGI